MDKNLAIHDIDDFSVALDEFNSSLTVYGSIFIYNNTEERAQRKILQPPISPPCQRTLSFENSQFYSYPAQVMNFKSCNNMYNSEKNEVHRASRLLDSKRTPLQVQDHIIVERKCREKLSQIFVALSKGLPSIYKEGSYKT